ncbi:Rieske (2Fe-2S) protein [Psychrobacter lutiphocae]|uniref:Rieske (2Fe-2S) protein n=1 Tax=Psychrobacter lutiphocae TaxID=540500 RepID=UPI00035D7FC0|nr:Rieske 2Fe-2S domain-containing protein [Psychrobacter lutiphocae]
MTQTIQLCEQIKLCEQRDFEETNCLRVPNPNNKKKSILIIKKDNALYAYENSCPHFSIPLDYKKGKFHTYKNEVVMCAHHSAMFNITTGECIDGPCMGHSLTSIAIQIVDGEVFLIN